MRSENHPVRLGPDTAARLPETIRRPGFDRTRLRPRILHIGAGAFHRCHQVEWTDDANESDRESDWGIVALNLRAPNLGPVLGEQAGLFCRELRQGGTAARRLLGSEIEAFSVLDPDEDPSRQTLAHALRIASDPGIELITLTVTEKGYCHIPATGQLDTGHPDIRHDIANPGTPRSAPGFILAVLLDRMRRGLSLPTLISCDNVPDNGATLRNSVLGLCELTHPAMTEALARDGRFLNTMVDRIVPATREEDIGRFAAETGVLDRGLVIGEPYRMWVIEDRWRTDFPAWQRCGALVVEDVHPYELLKMRVLNGIQSGVCQLGVLSKIEFMADLMAKETFRAFARRTIADEVLPGLPAIAGIDVDVYLDQSIERLRNPDLRHATAQISMDGSQKIRQRLLEPLRWCLAQDRPANGLLLGIAGWMVYAGGRQWNGEPIEVRDPFAEQTTAIGERRRGDAAGFVDEMLSIGSIFGTDLRGLPDVGAMLARYVGELWRKPAEAVVSEHLAEERRS